jgi:uncharacterized surface protein with fasciclin (FAS1) repeats
MSNIVETAVSSGKFKTLTQAVQAAGLSDTLSGEGPYTVFAPDDEAFEKLPEGTLENLLQDIPRLKDILTYHVVPGKMMASDTSEIESAMTVEGKELHISAREGVKVNDATVIGPDIMADNGVIHEIDSVLIPQ